VVRIIHSQRPGRSCAVVSVAFLCCTVVAWPAEGSRRVTGQHPNTGGRVVVGPGIAEDTVRQVVRTARDAVLVFAPDDTAQRHDSGPGVIRAYLATGRGVPRGFAEADTAHHPSSSGTHVLYAPDVRLDRRGVAHLVYVDQATDRLYYQTFSTVTNTWGTRRDLGGEALANPGFYATPARVYRNWASYGLVLDRSDRPHVVYCSGSQVLARLLTSSGWSKPQVVASGRSPLHVQLASDTASNIDATWLDDPLGAPGATSVMYAQQARSGVWSAPQVVDRGSPNVLSDVTFDQGPSIAVTGAGAPFILYLSGTTDSAGKAVSTATVRHLRNGRWLDDTPPAGGYTITHSPQIYTRGNDVYVFLGHDANIHWGYLAQHAGRPWSRYVVLDATSRMDGSASVRWDPQRDHAPDLIDAVHHSEDYQRDGAYLPQLYYQAVRP
jgi:hypothetical protein